MPTLIKRASSKNVGAVATQVGGYTAPTVATGVYVTGLVVANSSASPAAVTVDVFDGATHFNLCTSTPVPVGSSINLADNSNRLALNANDKVFVTTPSGLVDVNMSVSEIT